MGELLGRMGKNPHWNLASALSPWQLGKKMGYTPTVPECLGWAARERTFQAGPGKCWKRNSLQECEEVSGVEASPWARQRSLVLRVSDGAEVRFSWLRTPPNPELPSMKARGRVAWSVLQWTLCGSQAQKSREQERDPVTEEDALGPQCGYSRRERELQPGSTGHRETPGLAALTSHTLLRPRSSQV